MKTLLLAFALVAGIAACSSPKNSVSDATGPKAADAECAGACEAGKSECCSEKAASCSTKEEAKTCPMTGKVQG